MTLICPRCKSSVQISGKGELFVSSIYQFWTEEMTIEECNEFLTHVSEEERKQVIDSEYATPRWLPEVFGSDYDGIEHVLKRRENAYLVRYDTNDDEFEIREIELMEVEE